ncbi:hypothetical protein Tco_1581212, partial [Tanacetum coccineum]
SPSTSSIIVENHEAPPIETTSDEQTSPISLTDADEFNQEASADFNGNLDFVPYNTSSHEEIESSTADLESSNVQNFHQVQPSTYIWTKDHPLDHVISDLSKLIMTHQKLQTDSEVCMYALTVNTIEPNNIKEDKADHKGKNIIALKWLWKNKCDAKNTMEIYFVGTEYQLADLFTKALPKERFEYLVHRIGMRCMTPTQLESLTKLSS